MKASVPNEVALNRLPLLPKGDRAVAHGGADTGIVRHFAAPRVQESRISFECHRTQIVQLQSASGDRVATWLVFGEVVAVHIDQSLLKDGVYDTAGAGHILRGGGAADYFSMGPEQLFRMTRPLPRDLYRFEAQSSV